MLDRQRIEALIPHQGAMCLLDTVTRWDTEVIECLATSHLDPANPLRRDGSLGGIAGVEYGLQAMALHGALRGGGVAQPPGYLARLAEVELRVARLDDPSIGTLVVRARLELAQASGTIYRFEIQSADGRDLLSGRATIAL
jgi:predicted hotdog family 3-hydroxylacyl-ACP dehydratase